MKEEEKLSEMIAAGDSMGAKELIKAHPALKDFVNKKLYALVVPFGIKTISADKESFKTVQFLLEIGADPNYRAKLSNFTMLGRAAISHDMPLAKLLLEKGADLLTGVISNKRPDESDSEAALRQKSYPVQRAHEAYFGNHPQYREIFDFLSEETLKKSPVGQYIEKNFKLVFERLVEKIKKAKEEADRLGKPLMIFIGEGHIDYNSVVIEVMAYLAASKVCGINTVLVEKDKGAIDYFHKTGFIKTREISWVSAVDVAPFLKAEGATIIGIDEAESSFSLKNELESEHGVSVRDQRMATEAIKQREDVICIVGEGHMHGLLTKTALPNHFHMLNIGTKNGLESISEARESPSTMTLAEFDKLPHVEKAMGFSLAFPDMVHNVWAYKKEQYQGFVSPNVAISMIKNISENYFNKKKI